MTVAELIALLRTQRPTSHVLVEAEAGQTYTLQHAISLIRARDTLTIRSSRRPAADQPPPSDPGGE